MTWRDLAACILLAFLAIPAAHAWLSGYLQESL